METAIKPKVINDISVYELFSKKDSKIYCVGSRDIDRYFEVKGNIKDQVLKAIEYFDGTNTLEEIYTLLKEKDGVSLDIEKFYNLLQTTGLLENEKENKVEKSEYERISLKLLEVDISKNERTFNKLSCMVPFIFILTLILIPFSVANIKSNIGSFVDIKNFKINGSYIIGAITIVAIFFISILLHEIAHGIVARKYGLIPKNLVVSLYLFISPMVYLKIPGLYTIKENERIKVWIAGIYTNLFLALLSFSFIGHLQGELFKVVFVLGYINLMFIVMNLWPFLPLDGYFILSTLMKMPNLRKKSFKEFRKFIKGKENNLTFIYFTYFLVSIGFMSAILISQIIMVYKNFMSGYSMNHSILNALWNIKFYLVLITLAIIYKVKRVVTFMSTPKNSSIA